MDNNRIGMLEPLELPPIDPHHLMHYLVACKVAGVTEACSNPAEQRALIDRVSRLSIPDAVKLLRVITTEQSIDNRHALSSLLMRGEDP